MENDPYFLQYEKLINESWEENYSNQKNKKENNSEHVWGGGLFDSPPF